MSVAQRQFTSPIDDMKRLGPAKPQILLFTGAKLRRPYRVLVVMTMQTARVQVGAIRWLCRAKRPSSPLQHVSDALRREAEWTEAMETSYVNQGCICSDCIMAVGSTLGAAMHAGG